MNYFNTKMVEPDVLRFYWSFVAVFFIMIILVTILVIVLVKCLISDPIKNLQHKIENNDIDIREIKSREKLYRYNPFSSVSELDSRRSSNQSVYSNRSQTRLQREIANLDKSEASLKQKNYRGSSERYSGNRKTVRELT